jgi:CheY-like chemotaxis protein
LKSHYRIMSKPTTKCAIVLIDDNKVDLFLHEQLISHSGNFSPVWSFLRPADALDLLATLAYTEPNASYPILLLLDIKMPDMDGFSFLDSFEMLPGAIRRRCRIVMLSSTLQVSDAVRAEANPMVDAFVSKPLTIPSLLKAASNILANNG